MKFTIEDILSYCFTERELEHLDDALCFLAEQHPNVTLTELLKIVGSLLY
jgi:hypothetical protein